MTELFYMGGPLFMGILTLFLITILAIAVFHGLSIGKNKINDIDQLRHKLTYIKSFGLCALVVGILGQLIGLYSAFDSIENLGGSIPQEMLAGGLKVSMITTIYGAIIFIISYLLWLGLDGLIKKGISNQ
ncbi:MotA/TolQ/ExbB proton channel family protein [Fulvivirgaceae bacterium BMA10]|uniref:MotA/TolQ/ExbB proton channel family protein n=1 Tax=Splendidivirga corallicola TaxID=3051826 RepID=A0ABT8KRG5_9BACT|nr:MotA/TolQ/ExbB proton channel family protein [Fulvivirgaceae bacterium BMA10]